MLIINGAATAQINASHKAFDEVGRGCLPLPAGAVFGGRVRFREMRPAGCRCDDKRWWDGLDGDRP